MENNEQNLNEENPELISLSKKIQENLKQKIEEDSLIKIKNIECLIKDKPVTIPEVVKEILELFINTLTEMYEIKIDSDSDSDLDLEEKD